MPHGVGDREGGAALRDAEQIERRDIEGGGFDDRFEIAHPCLEREIGHTPVGEPAPAFVVADKRLMRRDRVNPVFPDRAFPFIIEVVEPVGRFDERRALARRLIEKAMRIPSVAVQKPDLLPQAGGAPVGPRAHAERSGLGLGRARYVGDKPISDARHRFDVGSVRSRLFAERAPERQDVVIEVVLFDRRVGPDALHQFLLRQQAAGVFDQHAQRVEHLRAEGDGAGRRSRVGARRLRGETARIRKSHSSRSARFQKAFRKSPRRLQDAAAKARA